jgi:hypothetical protein
VFYLQLSNSTLKLMTKFLIFKQIKKIRLACLLLMGTVLVSCDKEEIYENLPVYGPTQVFYALTNNNALITYNAKDVRTQTAQVAITGLQATEKLLSIDFRPATGELYGVSSANKVYIINPSTGATRSVSQVAFAPALGGITVSINFNPVVDRLRIVTGSGQNLRLNPETGQVVATDVSLTNTNITGIAYTNSYAGAESTVLYDLDPASGQLFKQDPPNNGTLVSVGKLGADLGNNVSFDISPDGSNALAVGKVGDSTKLFTINLNTGKATLAGKFVLNTSIRGIAIPAAPAAYAVDVNNKLLIFNPTLTTAPTIYSKTITGLQNGETIYGMDMSPINGQLYAIGSTNRLYTVNIGTGQFTQVGTSPLGTALDGSSFGFDFNPLTGQINILSNTRQSLQLNPTTLAITLSPVISPANATISAAAFNNNFSTATASTLYAIDHTQAKLYSLALTSGVLTEVGALKVNIGSSNGFDINADNLAYGVFTVAGKNSVYSINLATGEATAKFDLPQAVSAFALGLRANGL